ncbi:cytochrome P450 [Aquihabitans sp. McL0605]|uniref:cytochrome P450 n=1 Tax=Aquihabitans sp. McL0605 TaxID=3415671 RepID=UPI003CEE6113
MTDLDDVDYYLDPSLADDPHPYFHHIRSKCPVVHLPQHDVMAVTTYEATAEVLRDHETFSSCNAVGGPFPGFSVKPEPSDDLSAFIAEHRAELPMSEYAVALDEPEHNAQRALIMRLFTPKRMKENEAFMYGLADRLIDEHIGTGKIETQGDFGPVFALLVIADLLGVPEEDHTELRKTFGGLPTLDEAGDGGTVAHDPLAFLQEKFAGYIEDRRRQPRNDVLTSLAQATYADGSIPDIDTICRMATFVFAAGQDTTARLITAGLRIIGDDPEIQAYLRADHERIPNFVEEVLRHDGVVRTAGRTAVRTTTIAGVEIPAGTSIGIFPGCANRDPARFEDPDEFRPDRPNANEHLAFGRGIHACPGGPLSRIEARVALERFLDRTTDIQIDPEFHGPPGDRRWQFEPIYILHGLQALHLLLTPAEVAK